MIETNIISPYCTTETNLRNLTYEKNRQNPHWKSDECLLPIIMIIIIVFSLIVIIVLSKDFAENKNSLQKALARFWKLP